MAKGHLNACLETVFKWEGGYVNHPKDPGGPTNRGITQATLSHERGQRASIDDVRNLTRAEAAEIYRKKYWNLIQGEALPAGVDLLALDIAVNSGPGRALSWLNETAGLSPPARLARLDRKRRRFWQGLKTFCFFGQGWMNRENDVYRAARAMLEN